MLLLLDNVWPKSLETVQKFLAECHEDVRVVLTSREERVIGALDGGEVVNLNELSLGEAMKMLRQ
jgi:hypothetical protein